MRRRHLVIGFVLITLSAAAAVAILPQNRDDLRGDLPFLPTELWSLLGKGRPPSGNPGGPPQNAPTGPRSDPFSAIDLPIDTARIHGLDFLDDTVGEEPASEPFGGEGHTAKGAGQQSSDTGHTSGPTTDGDLLDPIIPGDGYFAASGGGLINLASNQNTANNGVGDSTEGGSGSGGGLGGGGGSGGDPNGSGGDPNGNNGDANDNDRVDTNQTEKPAITVDEPAPLTLLLVGGLALVLARRAKRRAAR